MKSTARVTIAGVLTHVIAVLVAVLSPWASAVYARTTPLPFAAALSQRERRTTVSVSLPFVADLQETSSSPDARKRRVGEQGVAQSSAPASSETKPAVTAPAATTPAQTSTPDSTAVEKVAVPKRPISRGAKRAVETATPLPASIPAPSVALPPSVWSPPAHAPAPTPVGVAQPEGFWSSTGIPALWARFREFSRSRWRWLGPGVVLISAAFGLWFASWRARGDQRRMAKYRRWSDQKIGPRYESRDETSLEHRVVLDEIDRLAEALETDEDEPPATEAINLNSGVTDKSTEAAVDPTAIEIEVSKLLEGIEFDRELIGSPDTATRKTVEQSLVGVLRGREFPKHELARSALFDFGYFDDISRELSVAHSTAEREMAATKLGVLRDSRAVTPLIPALNDISVEVRRAAVEALGQIGDEAAIPHLTELLKREISRDLPEAVIRHAINSITNTQARRAATPAARSIGVGQAFTSAREDNQVDDRVESEAPLAETETSIEPKETLIGETRSELVIAEQQELRRVTEEIERLRLEVAAAKQAAAEEARILGEMSAQIRLDEESRRQVQEELARLQLEARNRLEEERVRFEEARQSVLAEQRRVAAETHKALTEDQERLAALEAEKQRVDEEIRNHSEQERRLKAEIDELYNARAEQRARIEVETRRRAEAEFELRTAKARFDGEQVTGRDDFKRGDVESTLESRIPAELLSRYKSELSHERAGSLAELTKLGDDDAFQLISSAFDDGEALVRNAAARALYEISEDSAATYTRALRESSAERRRRIGAALASSGLAHEAIPRLTAEDREETYDAFSLLFLMARAGETEPLINALEENADLSVRVAVAKLLGLTGQNQIVPRLESLSVSEAVPSELKAAINDALQQLSQSSKPAPTTV